MSAKADAVGSILHFGGSLIGLQLRDATPGIQFPGMITPFGGALEGEESPLEGVQRELEEELGITVLPSQCELDWRGMHRNGYGELGEYHLFIVRGVELATLRPREGHLCVTDGTRGLSLINIVECVREPVEAAVAKICSAGNALSDGGNRPAGARARE